MSHRRICRLLLSAAFACAIFGVPGVADAQSWRCNGRLVEQGDPAIDVEHACGEPSYVSPWAAGGVPGFGPFRSMQAWTYNPGPGQLIHIVLFENGEVQDIETDGYGFTPGQPGDCDGTRITQGLSEYRLLAACGEPDQSTAGFFYSSQLDAGGQTYYLDQGVFPTYQEIWFYNFGPNRLEQKIILQNGRVVDVQALGRGFSR